LAGPVVSFEEEHEAHEHGHASLLIVQEKDELQLQFTSPAMNIVGFEHQASTPEQHAKIEAASHLLGEVDRLFQLNKSAQCVLEHKQVRSALIEEGAHEDEGEHAEESHAKAHDNDHHEDEHDEEHGDGHGESERSHSEFEAEYHFECENISAMKTIKVLLLSAFPSINELETQVITSSGQRLFELDQKNVSIDF